jgi:hypothetical protein
MLTSSSERGWKPESRSGEDWLIVRQVHLDLGGLGDKESVSKNVSHLIVRVGEVTSASD